MICVLGVVTGLMIASLVITAASTGYSIYSGYQQKEAAEKQAAKMEAREAQQAREQKWEARKALFETVKQASRGYAAMELRAHDAKLKNKATADRKNYFGSDPQYGLNEAQQNNQRAVDTQTQRFHGRPVRT